MRYSTMFKENIIKEWRKERVWVVSGPVGHPDSFRVHERSPKTINQSTNYKFLGLSLSTTSLVYSLNHKSIDCITRVTKAWCRLTCVSGSGVMICLQSIIARKRLATSRHRDIRGYCSENSALHHNYELPGPSSLSSDWGQCWPLNSGLEKLLARRDLIVSSNRKLYRESSYRKLFRKITTEYFKIGKYWKE